MLQADPVRLNLREDAGLIPVAAILGASAGLFIHAYWLQTLMHLRDEQTTALVALLGLAAAAAYLMLLKWMRRNIASVGSVRLVLLSVLLGTFLFFGGTSRWQEQNRYPDILLPRHELQLTGVGLTEPGQIALLWFTTSLGDVSYDTIGTRGWERRGDELVQVDPADNSLTWSGRTGKLAQLIFRGTKAGNAIRLNWDGQGDTIPFSRTKTSYEHVFGIPFYATHAFLNVLGLANFLVLSAALLTVVMRRRSTWEPAVGRIYAASDSPIGIGEAAGLLGLVGVALLLRGFNLGNVYPAVDEYYHLIAAQQIAQGAELSSVYQRGLWLVTVPISAALRIFGHQLWAARLVGAVFNSLAIVPLYFLSRKIGRPVSWSASLLFATSPWIITFARVAREYAYYPFYFYAIVLAMVTFVEAVPARWSVVRDWRAAARPRVFLLGAVLLLPPLFALRIDWLSTFRTVLIAYLVFGVFVLSRFDWADRLNWPILAILGVALLLLGLGWYREQGFKLSLLPTLNLIPLEYFLPNPEQQWYFNRLAVVIALAIVAALVISWLVRRANFVPLFVMTLFASYLAVFALFSKVFFHTRHLLTTELWFVPVAAMGLYAVWRFARSMVPQRGVASVVILTVLIAAVVNVPQVLLPTVARNADMPISEDYMHDMSQVQSFMVVHARSDDALVSTVYGLYATWEQAPTFGAQLRITSHTPADEIYSFVDQYASGWIVIDKIRLDLSGMSPNSLTGSHQIEYIGVFGDEYVWHWQRTPPLSLHPGAVE